MKNKIVLKKVSVRFDNNIILDNISFEVYQNKPLCIIGRGSSGKSTILKSILGLIKLSSGSIYINNKSISDENIDDLFSDFGVVFQKDALFDSLNVWQNVMFKSLNKLSKDDLIDKAIEVLTDVGLNKNDAFLFPSELSGGMRKRVAIARAISHNPKYLILDEPTAGLDPIKTNIIFKIIKRLSSNFKTTLLVVTSDMRGVIKYFDDVVVLEDKKLHWMGNVKTMKKKPTKHIKELMGSYIS